MCLLTVKRGSWFFFSRNDIACVATVSVWFRSKERPRNGIHRFGRARNETRAKKWKWGKGEGREGFLPFFPTPSPLFYLSHFSRGLWLSFLVLCSLTAQKRLLRRLEMTLSVSVRRDVSVYNIILFGDRLRWPMMSFACERKSSYLRLRNVIPVCGDI